MTRHHARSITVTVAYEPRASTPDARTKAGRLRKPARQWHDGLAWATKLELLGTHPDLAPPYVATVHSYVTPRDAARLPALQEWSEVIATALGEGLSVAPEQIQIKPGRIGYPPPFAPSHFEIVVTRLEEEAPPTTSPVTCPACGARWALAPESSEDDCCPHCGHEDGGVPFILGLL